MNMLTATLFALPGLTGIAAAALTSSLAVLLAAIIIAGSLRLGGKPHRANTLHARAATYQLFLDLWGTLLQPGYVPDGNSAPQVAQQQRALDRLVALYGSPGVVKTYAEFCSLAVKGSAQKSKARSQFAKTLLEMRQDLGSQAWGLAAEELQQLLFSNSEAGDASVKPRGYPDVEPRISLWPPEHEAIPPSMSQTVS